MTGAIRAPEAPDFAPHIDELLEKAGVTKTPNARSSLESYLHLAWADVRSERVRAPPEDFKQLKDSIKKTQTLLRRLEKFQASSEIGCDFCPVGEGTISIAKFPQTLELPRNPPPLGPLPERIPPGGTTAAINRKRMLDRLLREIAHTHEPRRKRGNQQERDKFLVAAHARSFFRQFSTVEPTTYFNGPFAKFCRSFYEVVTGKTLSKSGLEKTIRKELKKPTLGTQKPQKT
jgi:hypothetical protein